MYQEELRSIIDRGKKGLGRLSGNRKLAALLNLIRTLKPYSTKAAEELIDNNIDLIERTRRTSRQGFTVTVYIIAHLPY